MNKISSLLIVLGMSLLMLAGCNSNTPKNVASKWLTSFYHMDYKEAKKYSTVETQRVLEMLESFATAVADSQKKNAEKIKIEIKDVKEDGDRATVNYMVSDDDQEKSIHLVKTDSKWLVNYSKQDKMEEESMEETEAIEEQPMTEEGNADSITTSGDSIQP